MEMDPYLSSKSCNPNLDLELDLELTPPHDLRWDIDGIGARDGGDPKLRFKKVQPQYGSGSGYVPELTPQNEPYIGIDGDRLDPKLRSKSCNPNMDLELELELIPHMI